MATFKIDGSNQFMRESVENCNKILDGNRTVDLFGYCRVDPKVPIEETTESLGQLAKKGKIGVFNCPNSNWKQLEGRQKFLELTW